MKRCLVVLLALSNAASAFAAAAPQRSLEGVWSGVLNAGRGRILQAAPQFIKVRMTIDRSSQMDAVVTEPSLGINVDVSRGGLDSFWINGYLKASARPLDRRSTLSGVTIMGGGVNVDMKPFGGQTYLLSGVYKDAEGRDGSLNLRFDLQGEPLRDMTVAEKGLELRLRWTATGYEVEGRADPAVYGKRELAVIGASVATLTWDSFGR